MLREGWVVGHIVTNLLSGMISRDAPALMRTVAQVSKQQETRVRNIGLYVWNLNYLKILCVICRLSTGGLPIGL
jgi:hypothetical protein